MDTFYPMISRLPAQLQPLPDEENEGLYRTAVYAHDDGAFSVFCKHRFVRHYESPVDLPPEVAVTLGLVALAADEPLFKHEDQACWSFVQNAWALWDNEDKPSSLGQWVTPHLYVLLLTNETHEDMIYEYIGNNNDPRIKGESPSPKDTG
jgi:hypothetical protein